ncbi:MAG: UDP-N-acetylglucosamine 2-epimerase (non-hydrolyzing) [Oligoflexia bacterium]|nr:UDP-N-acetylglucosamine 2-epimerase (non-hydrolyzing) [Oligoflexia bacterium]
MKIAISIGTRPEIIKMSPVIKELQRRKINFILIHTNQHYDKELDDVFFQELNLPKPDYELHPDSLEDHSHQIGNIMIRIEDVFRKEKPDLLLVQGDTNSVLASALIASKLNIKIGHVEAGLRSYDQTMPEEVNRRLTDHMSDFLFAVTSTQEEILLEEGISKEKVFVVGNTVVDALVNSNIENVDKEELLKKYNLKAKDFFVFTAHRASNVDAAEDLEELLRCLRILTNYKKVIWPIHPRTERSLNKFGLDIPAEVLVTKPLGYIEFLSLIEKSSMVVTDSGGLQEESCILKVPCITLRENTERPESVEIGSNIVVGRNVKKLQAAIEQFINSTPHWTSPFGDGMSAKRIVDLIEEKSNAKKAI